MAQRRNWQLGREMEYPYDGPPPQRQVAYIFDTNKCIECQTCTVACKTCWTSGKGQETIFWNNVETKPYGGDPLQWDSKLLQITEPARWEGERTKIVWMRTSAVASANGSRIPAYGAGSAGKQRMRTYGLLPMAVVMELPNGGRAANQIVVKLDLTPPGGRPQTSVRQAHLWRGRL